MRFRILVGFVILAGFALAFAATRGRTLPLGIHTLHADDPSLRRVQALGAQYVVQVFAWDEIEPTRDEFHWEYTDWLLRAADFYNLRVIARLDKPPQWAASVSAGLSAPPRNLNDYGDFVAAVASRYQGRLAGYIIWNEPNLAREWGNLPPDPVAYAGLLGTAASRIRQFDPHTPIVSAGLAPTNETSDRGMDDRAFLSAMYSAGARDSFDVLGAHPYAFQYPPDDLRGAHRGLNLARLEDLRDIMVANGDAAKPVWVTEFGYTTQSPPDSPQLGVTQSQQAEYTARAYELLRSGYDWVQLFTVWNLAQGLAAGDEQAGYSLTSVDGSPRPVYAAIQDMQKQSSVAALGQSISQLVNSPPLQSDYSILARDAVVHLGDSEYPAPWVPLYGDRNPSADWQGEFYLRSADLQGKRRTANWKLTLELMQVNDFDSRVLINGQAVQPAYLPTADFTSIWVSARFQVPAAVLQVGRNVVALHDGKLFPAFQQLGFTWDDFQVRNVTLSAP
jgi:polysaccharide biosynthesis protein PslG